MKKTLWVLILIVVGLLCIYVYSSARQKTVLSKPEDMAGEEASAFMPKEVKGGQPAAKGSADMKVTGPVWVEK